MGVKRAVEKALALARTRKGPIFTFGPLIHNRQVVQLLEERGICARTEFPGIREGTVLLRAHGVPPDVVEALRRAGLDVEDGTCPHVLRGQRSIARRSAEGYHVIIVGDRNHDEVQGLAGHAVGPCAVIATVEEARNVALGGKVLVVAQTTFEGELFRQIVAALRARKPDIEVVDSICTATSERQEEVRRLAARVDAVVVVGGFHSANTTRLVEIARSTGTPTFHVETADDLVPGQLAGYRTVGVTAGASTPSWITNAVIDRLRSIGREGSPVRRAGTALARFLIDGNIYVAAGAAALAYASTRLLDLDVGGVVRRAFLMIAAFGYIFSAYSFGRMAESRRGGSGLTRRSAFSQAHPTWLAVSSALLAVVSIAVLVKFGWLAVALLGVSYAMAIAYGTLAGPPERMRLAFLRNVPASKDLLVAAGWTVVAVVVPAVAARSVSVYAVGAVAAFVFGLAFIRSVMFDFSDVMGDRLIGRDTLPALVGIVRAKLVLGIVALLLAVVVAGARSAGLVGGPGYWMLLCPGYVLWYVVFGDAIAVSERRCALVVDGGMLLAGAIALADRIGS